MKTDRTAPAGAPAGAPTRRQASPSCGILLVDDDSIIRRMSAGVLALAGYQVDTAEDGQCGWEALQAKNYDLLITDNNMPRVSGVELVSKLRSEGTALPVILVTGSLPTDEELDRHPPLQLSATLLKPFTGDQLVGTVKQILRPAVPASPSRPRRSGETDRQPMVYAGDDFPRRPGFYRPAVTPTWRFAWGHKTSPH